MPQSLSRVVVHGVFSTKNRVQSLNPEILKEISAYLTTVLANQGHSPINHIHVLFGLSRTMTIAKTIEIMKTSTSKWLKTKSPELSDFWWQLGYGIFGVSEDDVPAVSHYISNQAEIIGQSRSKMSFAL
jgi:putative transposase